MQAATLPPASWYIDPAFFELEKLCLWGRGWQCVGSSDRVSATGAYFCGRFMERPYLVVRGDDGALKAFYNVCRHHGAELVSDAGRARKFVCPYHGWTYALDGALKAAPAMLDAQNFDKSAYGLKPIPVCETGPLIWLQVGGRTASPTAMFNSVWPRLEHAGYARLRFHSRRTYEIRCNWKVYVDNYLDGGYHVGLLHRQLSRQLKLGAYRTEIGAGYAIQTVEGRGSDRIGNQALYVWLYPNFMINRYGPVMDTNWVIPLAPDRCLTVFDFYFAETRGAKAQAFIRRSIEASAQVQDEDTKICESVQRGLESGVYEAGRYAPRVEHAMHVFHRQLALDLQTRRGAGRAPRTPR